MIAEAIQARLLTRAGVIAALATHEFTTGVPTPAIFTIEPVGEDVEYPAIVIQEAGGPRWGSFESSGGFFEADVEVRDQRDDRSTKSLRDLAQLVWEALDLANLVVPGYHDVGTYADMPQEQKDDDGFPVFLIPTRTRLIAV